jgi:hypothetical protein
VAALVLCSFVGEAAALPSGIVIDPRKAIPRERERERERVSLSLSVCVCVCVCVCTREGCGRRGGSSVRRERGDGEFRAAGSGGPRAAAAPRKFGARPRGVARLTPRGDGARGRVCAAGLTGVPHR